MQGAMPPQPAVFVHVKRVHPDGPESFPPEPSGDPLSGGGAVQTLPFETCAVELHVNVDPFTHPCPPQAIVWLTPL